MQTMLALDPGNRETGWCIVDTITRTPLRGGKDENTIVSAIVTYGTFTVAAIEIIESYGMAVGRDVFETCEWIGRFTACACGIPVKYVYRLEEKITLCNSSKAKDANIRQALIDTYAKFDFKNGRGTKATPDTLYGFHADVWSALAVATTFMLQESGLGHYASWRKK